MRLYNIYYICKSALPDIHHISVLKHSNGVRKITSWISYKRALHNLSIIDFIKDDVATLYNILDPIDREKEILKSARIHITNY